MEPPEPQPPSSPALYGPASALAVTIQLPDGLSILLGLLLSSILAGLFLAYRQALFSLPPATIEELHQLKGRWAASRRNLLKQPKLVLAAGQLLQYSVLLLGLFWLMSAYTLQQWYWLALWVAAFGWLSQVGFPLWGQRRARAILVLLQPYALFWVTLLAPLAWPLGRLLAYANRPRSQQALQSELSNLERAIALQTNEDSPPEEKALLRALIGLSKIPVKAIMRARVEMKALELSTPTHELLEKVREWGFSRLPVQDHEPDKICGILYVKDLLPFTRPQNGAPPPPDDAWHALIRPAYFVPQAKKIHLLLSEFKQKRLHIAIVVDEYGGTAGIVTLHDVLEEIFGDISDELDNEQPEFWTLQNGAYLFDARIGLHNFARALGLQEAALAPIEEAETLSGLILERTGELPTEGSEITLAGHTLHIEAVTPTAIRRVRVLPSTKS